MAPRGQGVTSLVLDELGRPQALPISNSFSQHQKNLGRTRPATEAQFVVLWGWILQVYMTGNEMSADGRACRLYDGNWMPMLGRKWW